MKSLTTLSFVAAFSVGHACFASDQQDLIDHPQGDSCASSSSSFSSPLKRRSREISFSERADLKTALAKVTEEEQVQKIERFLANVSLMKKDLDSAPKKQVNMMAQAYTLDNYDLPRMLLGDEIGMLVTVEHEGRKAVSSATPVQMAEIADLILTRGEAQFIAYRARVTDIESHLDLLKKLFETCRVSAGVSTVAAFRNNTSIDMGNSGTEAETWIKGQYSLYLLPTPIAQTLHKNPMLETVLFDQYLKEFNGKPLTIGEAQAMVDQQFLDINTDKPLTLTARFYGDRDINKEKKQKIKKICQDSIKKTTTK